MVCSLQCITIISFTPVNHVDDLSSSTSFVDSKIFKHTQCVAEEKYFNKEYVFPSTERKADASCTLLCCRFDDEGLGHLNTDEV